MTEVAYNDKLLIHFFYKSLTGDAQRWYMQLDSSRTRSWKDLADAFIRQYGYNLDTASTQTNLQNMEKKNSKYFKEYAKRWFKLIS